MKPLFAFLVEKKCCSFNSSLERLCGNSTVIKKEMGKESAAHIGPAY